ncbi:MAG: DUF3761 domain-containing protein [Candidatus Dormibacteraeota bacterium]|nr:DUF3761 domain-containing protein [Candidatus Dormibacteraeota bacterium]
MSADGAWQWNGTAWIAIQGPESWISDTGGLLRVAGVVARVPWRIGMAAVAYVGVVGLALFSLMALVGSAIGVLPPPTTTSNAVAQVGSPASSPSPSQVPGPSPIPIPTPTPQTSLSPLAHPVNTCGAPLNPWGYNFCGGKFITHPPSTFCSYFNCIHSFWVVTIGYVDACKDGTYSHSGGRRGVCARHHGELRPLYSP